MIEVTLTVIQSPDHAANVTMISIALVNDSAHQAH
jgi:hypothetical protein